MFFIIENTVIDIIGFNFIIFEYVKHFIIILESIVV